MEGYTELHRKLHCASEASQFQQFSATAATPQSNSPQPSASVSNAQPSDITSRGTHASKNVASYAQAEKVAYCQHWCPSLQKGQTQDRNNQKNVVASPQRGMQGVPRRYEWYALSPENGGICSYVEALHMGTYAEYTQNRRKTRHASCMTSCAQRKCLKLSLSATRHDVEMYATLCLLDHVKQDSSN